MATHRIDILGALTKFDSSGEVYIEPFTAAGVNDQFDHYVLVMNDDDSNKVGVSGVFEVPQNYVDNAAIIVVWTANVTSNDAVFDFDYRAVGGNDTESLDQASYQESATVTDTAPSAVHERLEASISLTAGNLAAGDTVEFKLSVDGANANCTISDKCLIYGILFEYTDA